jgi:hypothetical protein
MSPPPCKDPRDPACRDTENGIERHDGHTAQHSIKPTTAIEHATVAEYTLGRLRRLLSGY